MSEGSWNVPNFAKGSQVQRTQSLLGGADGPPQEMEPGGENLVCAPFPTLLPVNPQNLTFVWEEVAPTFFRLPELRSYNFFQLRNLVIPGDLALRHLGIKAGPHARNNLPPL